MDSENRVVYHGATAADSPNPPPYSGYPPPGPAQYPHPGPPVAIVHAPTVMFTPQMGLQPTPIVCKSCHAEIVTRVEKQSTTKTHLFALGLCLLGCWCCVCIPYCTDTCRNTNHYCPNCNAYIGAYIN